MPKVEVEILRTVTITREQSVVVELDVPQKVVRDGEVVEWIDQIMEGGYHSLSAKDKKIREAIDAADWATSDEDESAEYNEVYPVD